VNRKLKIAFAVLMVFMAGVLGFSVYWLAHHHFRSAELDINFTPGASSQQPRSQVLPVISNNFSLGGGMF